MFKEILVGMVCRVWSLKETLLRFARVRIANQTFLEIFIMGYKLLPPIDRERYTDLSHEGLEGPFMFSTGKVLYYDPQEGKYYDRDTDIYVDHKEMWYVHYDLAESRA